MNTTIHPVDAAQIKLNLLLDRMLSRGGEVSVADLCRIPGATRKLVDAVIDAYHVLWTPGRKSFRITARKAARLA